MAKGWKNWVFKKGEGVLAAHDLPLMAKEIAWKAVNFAASCGKSNPVSFALRLLVTHKHFRTAVGLNLAAILVFTAIFLPGASLAENINGTQSQSVVDSGEVNLKTTEGVQVPLKKYFVSQGYWFLHSGIDMATDTGEPIRPIMPGKVIMAEYNWFGYGNCVIIQHSADFESLYGHMSKILVKTGQEVNMDTVLGLVGSTGHSTGPHLHLEIHEDGHTVNPAPILGI